ncbi:MAG: hypothetical protein DWQ02_05315 [Bacteroidetes bacterium]|nr:MAG: hypothetical protein DWQ02_05315 [Bacteroidota bacterium]
MLVTSIVFGQTESRAVDTKQAKVEKSTPHYGVYEDLDDMKARFSAFVKIQQEEKIIEETPNDETLWEAAKGPEDFAGPKMINPYAMQRPVGYSTKVEKEKIDKETLSNNIKASLILSKSPAQQDDQDWKLKLKNNKG